jgi:hypothetical protein
MSRRSQVVRTDDQGGMSSPRSLGGCEILCAAVDRVGDSAPPTIPGGATTTIASIPVQSSANYQRCFVRGTIGSVSAHMPNPEPVPGFGEWTVTFELDFNVTTGRWASLPYSFVYADHVVTRSSWSGMSEFGGGPGFIGIAQEDDFGEFYELFDYRTHPVSGSETFDPPAPVQTIRMEATEPYGTCSIVLYMRSPHGEFEPDLVITDGGFMT